MAIYNITHSSDMDGMASAAMLVHYYNLPIENVIFTNYRGQLFTDTLKFIKNIKGSGHILIISDYGLNEMTTQQMKVALASFKKKDNQILWFDHHTWSDKQVTLLSKVCDFMVVGENKEMCGTELVYKFLCPHSEFGDLLARLTHLSDFALKSESSKEDLLLDKIGYAIKYLGNDDIKNPKLLQMVLDLANGDINSKLVNDAYKSYYKEARPYLRKLLKSAKIIKINGVKIAIGFGEKLSHQEACMTMIGKLKVDISIYSDAKNGHSSIRSERDPERWGIDSAPIAVAFAGGGHPLASGFTLEGRYDFTKPATRNEIIKEITKIAEKLYSKKINYYQQITGKTKIRKSHSR